jgi:hypothetical protein
MKKILLTGISVFIMLGTAIIVALYSGSGSIQRYVDSVAIRHSQNRVTVYDKIFWRIAHFNG